MGNSINAIHFFFSIHFYSSTLKIYISLSAQFFTFFITETKTVLFIYWIINAIYFLSQFVGLASSINSPDSFWNFLSLIMNMLLLHAFIRNITSSLLYQQSSHNFLILHRKKSIEKAIYIFCLDFPTAVLLLQVLHLIFHLLYSTLNVFPKVTHF